MSDDVALVYRLTPEERKVARQVLEAAAVIQRSLTNDPFGCCGASIMIGMLDAVEGNTRPLSDVLNEIRQRGSPEPYVQPEGK